MLMRTLVLSGLLVCAIPAFAQNTQRPPMAQELQGPATIMGRVVAASSGEAIEGANITIQTPTGRKTAKSAADGHFVLAGLPPGTYTVLATRDGFISKSTRATLAATTAGSTVGDRVDLGDVALQQGSTIAGLILDGAGKAVAKAAVSVTRAVYSTPGKRLFMTEGKAESNADGEFRIAGLKPGNYFLSAQAPGANASTFFPGTTNASNASMIIVRSGLDALGMDVRLLPAPLVTISGRVISAVGTAASAFAVMVHPTGNGSGITRVAQLSTQVAADGRFSIPNVPPGTFVIEALLMAKVSAIANSGSSASLSTAREMNESANVTVTVDGHDVPEIALTTVPATLVSGRVTIDGRPLSEDMAKKMQVAVFDTEALSVLHSSFANLEPDSTFTAHVIPGRRIMQVLPQSLPAAEMPNFGGPVALKFIKVFGLDVADDGFDVDARAITDVEIAFTSKVTTANGHVTEGDKPVAGAGVIVFSTEERHWTSSTARRLRSASTGKDGSFSFAGLPDGSYYIVAVPGILEGEWAEPDYLKKLVPLATTFKIGEGETKTLELVRRPGVG